MKKKRFLSWVLSVVLLFGSVAALPEGVFTASTSITASAETYYSGSYEYKVLEDDTVEIVNCDGNPAVLGVFEIPSVIDNKRVSSIDAFAFSNTACQNVTKVIIPDGVRRIGDYLFYGFNDLEDVIIPSSVTYIGPYAFSETKWLQTQQKNNPLVIVNDIIIDGSLCSGELTIPEGVKSISPYAFYRCKSITSVYLSDSVETIGFQAFTECDRLKSIRVPKSTKIIEDYEYNNMITLSGIKFLCYKNTYGEKVAREFLNDYELLDVEHVEAKAVTCTEDGNIEYWTYGNQFYSDAKAINEITEEDTVVKALGHSFGEWKQITVPSCTQKGKKTRECTICEEIETRDVDALGHDYVDTVVAPTCTAKGYTNHKCSRCGDEYNDSETDIVAHTYGDWNIKSYDSKTGESKLERKCINCTHTETKTEKDTVQRYAGSGRSATAAEISKASFETAKTVVLAYGLNSADALAGVPLAAKYNAPILLTNTKTLPQETLAEIKRLKATNVIILGGEGAIGTDVENLLKKEGLTTQRIAGKTIFGTATAIAEQLTETPEEIFFVYAFNFADALSASTVAAVKGAPIIYLKTNGDIDADTAAYLEEVKGKVKKAYVIGGTGVINDDMMNKAKNALGLDTITRVAGANRYATCIEVNNTFKDHLTGNGICVAKGLDFPDALAGGVFAALKKMPLFLADGSLKDVQTNYLGNKDISNVYVFGGTGAVPNDLVERIAKAS